MSKKKDKVIDFGAYVNKRMDNNAHMIEKNLNDKRLMSDDFMDLAREADSREEALAYINKSIELDKSNVDAMSMHLAIVSESEIEFEQGIKKLIKKEEARLTKMNYLPDEVGYFWGIIETRPYMRLKLEYAQLINSQGKYKKTAAEFEAMLKLCPNDNLGVRHILMCIYAMLEDEESVLRIYNSFKYDDSVAMLLPLVVLYYKLDNNRKAESFLKKIYNNNKEVELFFKTFIKEDMLDVIACHEFVEDVETYQIGTVSEILAAVAIEIQLYVSVPSFFVWMKDACKKLKK